MTWDVFDVMRKYAYEHLKTPHNSLGAVRRALGGDDSGCNDEVTARAVAHQWTDNVFVKQFKRELIEEYGEEHFLPTKADLARELYAMGVDKTIEARDRVTALKEYALVRGFIEKVAAVNVNTGTVSNRVMVVQDHGSDTDWEAKVQKQQTKLIASATSKSKRSR
jgi:hypothetical protein